MAYFSPPSDLVIRKEFMNGTFFTNSFSTISYSNQHKSIDVLDNENVVIVYEIGSSKDFRFKILNSDLSLNFTSA